MKWLRNKKIIALAIAFVVIVGAIIYLEQRKPTVAPPKAGAVVTRIPKQTADEPAKDISTPNGFINTSGITIQELIGKKIILVDFWTYSCINCQRTQPYLNAWYEKYKDQGLEIIGIHTPEFEFESHYDNVARAVTEADISYPVVLDNDYSTWNAYGNRFWPRKYLIDIDGYIVYDHIGEGAYEQTEKKIQELLAQRMAVLSKQGSIASGIAAPRDIMPVERRQPLTPEIYFGSLRNEALGNGNPLVMGPQHFLDIKRPSLNKFRLIGDWYIDKEFAQNESDNARIVLRYQAARVYMVAGSDATTTITVKRDGKVIIPALSIKAHTLYPLVQDGVYGEHELEIIVNQSGLQAFTFTFG